MIFWSFEVDLNNHVAVEAFAGVNRFFGNIPPSTLVLQFDFIYAILIVAIFVTTGRKDDDIPMAPNLRELGSLMQAGLC